MTDLLTPEEQHALIESMRNSFGNCTCAQVGGRIAVCDGHRFLAEEQPFAGGLADRVMVMTYYRRMASLWTGPEFSRPFVSLAPEPDPLPPSITEPDKLPW